MFINSSTYSFSNSLPDSLLPSFTLISLTFSHPFSPSPVLVIPHVCRTQFPVLSPFLQPSGVSREKTISRLSLTHWSLIAPSSCVSHTLPISFSPLSLCLSSSLTLSLSVSLPQSSLLQFIYTYPFLSLSLHHIYSSPPLSTALPSSLFPTVLHCLSPSPCLSPLNRPRATLSQRTPRGETIPRQSSSFQAIWTCHSARWMWYSVQGSNRVFLSD